MSKRTDKEKTTFVCSNGHTLRQRSDKPAPKKCNYCPPGAKVRIFDPESKQAEQQAAQVATDAPKKRTRKKVTA